MRKSLFYALIAVPTLLLICLICFKKNSAVGISQDGVGPNGIARLSGGGLGRSESVWTNRAFLQLDSSRDEIRNFLNDSVAQLALSATAKSNAHKSCWGMLKAYGAGDWGTFLSVRFPLQDYDISPTAVRQFKQKGIVFDARNALNTYHDTWTNLFSDGGLYAEISMISNSVSVLDMPLAAVDQISFPIFTDIANQNWITIVSNTTFDYSRYLSTQKVNRAKFLRFFFFGKNGVETCAYMFSFVLDENSQQWLPCRMTVGYTGKPTHIVGYF